MDYFIEENFISKNKFFNNFKNPEKSYEDHTSPEIRYRIYIKPIDNSRRSLNIINEIKKQMMHHLSEEEIHGVRICINDKGLSFDEAHSFVNEIYYKCMRGLDSSTEREFFEHITFELDEMRKPKE